MTAASDDEQPVTTTTVTVSGGRDGLQGVQVIDPTTGLIHRPGETVEVAVDLARQWVAKGWVEPVDQAEPEATESTPPAAPARRKRPATKA